MYTINDEDFLCGDFLFFISVFVSFSPLFFGGGSRGLFLFQCLSGGWRRAKMPCVEWEKSVNECFLGGVWSQGRNLKKLTERHTRSGICGSIWPNAGKLTRVGQCEDWQLECAFLIHWVVVHGRWWFVVWAVWLISKTNEINGRCCFQGLRSWWKDLLFFY